MLRNILHCVDGGLITFLFAERVC